MKFILPYGPFSAQDN